MVLAVATMGKQAGTDRMSDGRRWRVRRIVGLAAAVVVAAIVPVLSSGSPASAATDINWVIATPGYVRTDLTVDLVATGPADNLVYTYRRSDQTLLAIDVDDFTVVAETTAPYAGMVEDMVVSADGNTVYILSQRTVFRFDADDLRLSGQNAVSSATRLATAADRPDRFALFGMGPVTMFDGPQQLSLAGTALEDAQIVEFGPDSDIVYASYSNGEVARFDVSGGSVVETARLDDPMEVLPGVAQWGLLEGEMVAFVRMRFGVHFQPLDQVTLAALGPPWVLDHRCCHSSEFIDVEQGVLASASPSGGSGVDDIVTAFDLREQDAPPTVWTIATSGRIDVVAALPGGIVVGVERSDSGVQGHLTVMWSQTLSSAFGDYHALPPARVLDTRKSIGVSTTRRLRSGETTKVQIAGHGGVPETGVLAVTLNVTVTQPTAKGWIKIWPSGADAPKVSNVNYVPGQTVANSATVALGADGSLDLNQIEGAETHVLFDVTGYYSDQDGVEGARYYPTGIERLVDTRRVDLGRFGSLGPGEFFDLEVPTSDGAPEGDPDEQGDRRTIAAALNVTVVRGTERSHISVVPPGVDPSKTSTLNFLAGDTRANAVIATMSTANTVRIYNHSGNVDVVVDLFGHYVERLSGPADQVGRFFPVLPFRRFDSRESSPFPGSGALEPQSALIFGNGLGWTDVMNVTVTRPTANGFLSVIPWAEAQSLEDPGVSNVNFRAGETVANAVYGHGGPDTAIINSDGFTHVVVDVFGYLTPEALESIDEYWAQFS